MENYIELLIIGICAFILMVTMLILRSNSNIDRPFNENLTGEFKFEKTIFGFIAKAQYYSKNNNKEWRTIRESDLGFINIKFNIDINHRITINKKVNTNSLLITDYDFHKNKLGYLILRIQNAHVDRNGEINYKWENVKSKHLKYLSIELK